VQPVNHQYINIEWMTLHYDNNEDNDQYATRSLAMSLEARNIGIV
jgi:hypothetical protein